SLLQAVGRPIVEKGRVDRITRRRAVTALWLSANDTQHASAATLAAVVIFSSSRTVEYPASLARLSAIVHTDRLRDSIAQSTKVAKCAQATGPIAGGLLAAKSSSWLPFVYGVSAAALLRLCEAFQLGAGRTAVGDFLSRPREILANRILLAAVMLEFLAVKLCSADRFCQSCLRGRAHGRGLLRKMPLAGAIVGWVAMTPSGSANSVSRSSCVPSLPVQPPTRVSYRPSLWCRRPQLSLRPGMADMVSVIGGRCITQTPVPLTRPADVVNASAALVFSLASDVHVASTADLLGLVAAVLAGNSVTLAIVLVAAAPKVRRRVMRAPRRNYISWSN
ncbi:hypothetical protein KIP88_43835, partial [Bradyrhizobium sp. SRL28]|uniref:hypothetical protein n=1 Tax=Bradyrhizobium sp. SRL28 TaxID=2836178 RepID=UPI001BDF0552